MAESPATFLSAAAITSKSSTTTGPPAFVTRSATPLLGASLGFVPVYCHVHDNPPWI
jgi:hypothetical protein